MCLPAALRPLFEAGKGDKISPGYQEPANWTRAAQTKRRSAMKMHFIQTTKQQQLPLAIEKTDDFDLPCTDVDGRKADNCHLAYSLFLA
ncbi:hypothetical protein T12_10182 [Trichinella patagoniensis]|uniref:Uncharacterized protein n=1 Tax=Trichinella patagoniensis TaxID=990121 RepID=A0A0V0ZYM4_9BILA|nr:hypothetical protein T12_10182 [Trichinella patagoniensis]